MNEISPEEESMVSQLINAEGERAAKDYLRSKGLSGREAKRVVERCRSGNSDLMRTLSTIQVESPDSARGQTRAKADRPARSTSAFERGPGRWFMYAIIIATDVWGLASHGWDWRQVLFSIGWLVAIAVPLEVWSRQRKRKREESAGELVRRED